MFDEFDFDNEPLCECDFNEECPLYNEEDCKEDFDFEDEEDCEGETEDEDLEYEDEEIDELDFNQH